MKITRIEPIHVSIPFEHGAPKPSEGLGAGGRFDALFVRVDTDAGITGWGEAFGYAAGPVTMAALTRIVAPFAVGRDATDIAGLMGELWFRTKAQVEKYGAISIGSRFQDFLGYGWGTGAKDFRILPRSVGPLDSFHRPEWA
jgi:L-alanine-DL-glutamate epimerase-like enolase superfamily enzyme